LAQDSRRRARRRQQGMRLHPERIPRRGRDVEVPERGQAGVGVINLFFLVVYGGNK